MNAIAPGEPVLDMLIIGAGISGIGMAVRLGRDCPGKSFAILDRRARPGGTWDLFRYPGIRSDSDMHTLGFDFAPWKHERAIADGPSILAYLDEIAARYDLRRHMRLGQKVISADWDSAAACWSVTTEDARGARARVRARFVFLGSGYYDYDQPHDAGFAGREDFAGTIIHPQFWPEDFDYTGKKVVVIGSGATAVTLVPALAAGGAAHVTMLQRTPTWMVSRPARDALANTLRRLLPERIAYALTRMKNIFFQDLLFKRARRQPEKVAAWLTGQLRRHLGESYSAADFTPPYNPWEQRLCLVPDADFFEAVRAGSASVVTGRIARFDAGGIVLESGERVDADVIVTATGLSMAFAGKIAFSIDGVPLDLARAFYYRNCMFSNVPNLAGVFGYLNASWTLRVDIVAAWLTRLLATMDANAVAVATPVLEPGHEPEEDDVFDFSSGYIRRGKHLMPRNAHAGPWRLSQDYRKDRAGMASAPIDDGIMRFQRLHVPAGG